MRLRLPLILAIAVLIASMLTPDLIYSPAFAQGGAVQYSDPPEPRPDNHYSGASGADNSETNSGAVQYSDPPEPRPDNHYSGASGADNSNGPRLGLSGVGGPMPRPDNLPDLSYSGALGSDNSNGLPAGLKNDIADYLVNTAQADRDLSAGGPMPRPDNLPLLSFGDGDDGPMARPADLPRLTDEGNGPRSRPVVSDGGNGPLARPVSSFRNVSWSPELAGEVDRYLSDVLSAGGPRPRPTSQATIDSVPRPLPRKAFLGDYYVGGPEIIDRPKPRPDNMPVVETGEKGTFDGYGRELSKRIPLSVTAGTVAFRVIRNGLDKVPVVNFLPGIVKDSIATGGSLVVTTSIYRLTEPRAGEEIDMRAPSTIPTPRPQMQFGPKERDALLAGQNPAWARESDINDRRKAIDRMMGNTGRDMANLNRSDRKRKN